MLQWIDPDTGRRKSKSAETDDPGEAEKARGDLEYELNHGKYQEASRMTWEAFRDLFEAEYLTGKRPATQVNHGCALDLFERLSNPRTLRGITERTLSLFVAAMRQHPSRTGNPMMPSSIHLYLQKLHAALTWAVEQKMLPAVPKFTTMGGARPICAQRDNSRVSAMAAFTLPTPQYTMGTPAPSKTPCDSIGRAMTTSARGASWIAEDTSR